MKKTWLVMAQEIRTTLRRKTFLIFAFGLPLVIAVIVIVLMVVNRDTTAGQALDEPDESGANRAGYVDEGGLIQALPPDTPIDWLVAYPDEGTAQAALEDEAIDAYYVIPADYVESGRIDYVTLEFNPLEDHADTSTIEWILLFNLLGGDAELAANTWIPIKAETRQLKVAGDGPDESSWIVELLPNLMSIVIYMVIIMSASVLIQAVTDEKKNRVMEVLLSSVSANQMVTGKILGVAVLGLLMMAAWAGLIWGVASFGGLSLNIPFDFKIPGDLLFWLCLYAFLGYLMYGSLMAGLGALAPDVKDVRSGSVLVLSPFIVAYMFMAVIIDSPGSPLSVALSLFPLTSPVTMITRMTAMDVPLWQSILAAVLQLLGAVVIIRLVAQLFRAQTLLSGQPFEMKRFLGALLGRA